MAEYEKKLKVKIAGGTVQDIKVYSDEADIPPWQKPLRTKFEGTFEGWVPTSPLGSPDASSLRVRHPNSDEIYVVNTIGRATAGSIIIKTVGAVEFTVPTGVRKLKITCVGGGASGNTNGWLGGYNGRGNPGMPTSFGGVLAPGGHVTVGSGPEAAQNGYYAQYGISAGVTTKKITENGIARSYSYSGGVGFGASSSGGGEGAGGNRGHIYSAMVDVSPGQIIKGYVGDGGGGAYGSASNNGGGDSYKVEVWSGKGASGGIYLEWGGLIE